MAEIYGVTHLTFEDESFPCFLLASEPSFQLQICADYSCPSPGTTQITTTLAKGPPIPPSHSLIVGDQ
jgi:hypothetical protein